MITPTCLDTAAKTVWGEARGEGVLGRLAVARVIVNRWRRTDGQFAKDRSILETCLRPFQFSCWNKDDPNLPAMQTLDANDKMYRKCLISVLEAIDTPDDADLTKGATHYATKDIEPYWAKGKEPCAVLGRHRFWNNIN